MALTAALKQLFLRRAANQAEVSGVSLEDALEAFAFGQVETFSDGRIAVSSQANGHSVSFAIPSAGLLTPLDIAECAAELLTLHSEVRELLPAATDTELRDAMLRSDRLTAVTRFRPDFSYPEAIR